jgi:hypothetical protein
MILPMSDRKSSLTLPAAVTLVVCLGLYVGAYYLTVCPAESSGKPYDLAWDLGPLANPPVYILPGGRELDGAIFRPIHWLDRKLRSRFWGPSI